MNANVTLTGAVDDARGLGVTVHQDHNGVRIDAGGIEITFELGKIGSLQTFMRLLADAACDARLWEISQAAQLETMDAALQGITETDPTHVHDWHCMGCGADYDGDMALHICLPGGPRSE